MKIKYFYYCNTSQLPHCNGIIKTFQLSTIMIPLLNNNTIYYLPLIALYTIYHTYNIDTIYHRFDLIQCRTIFHYHYSLI